MSLTGWQGQTEGKQGSGLSFFFGRTFPKRGCPSTFGNNSHSTSSLFLTSLPIFQWFTCKNLLIRYKNQNSRYLSFLHWKIFLNPYLYSFFSLQIPDGFLADPGLVSSCRYMCWASIMSKYLASMIWGSTLFLNTEQTESMSVVSC